MMYPVSPMSRLCRSHNLAWVLGSLLLLVSACSGPAAVEPPPATPTPVVEAPSGPPYAVIYADQTGLHLFDAARDMTASVRGVTVEASMAKAAPQGEAVATVYQTSDSTTLVLMQGEDVRWLHSVAGEAEYTLAWQAGGRTLAFGFYTPVVDGDQVKMGAGGVRTVALGERVEDVGCSASKAVYMWLPNGDLIVGNDDNHYVVDANNCATKSTFPLRKRRSIQYAPGGQHMSYIFRDLVYNRERRAYEPESTLFVANVDGTNENRLMTDRFKARNMAWSPDGTQLAFDVQSQDNEGVRQVAIHNVGRSETTYLVPPADGQTFSDTHPSWSPTGARMAYDRSYPDGTLQKVVYTTLDLQSRVIDASDAQTGRIVTKGWAGDDALVLHMPDGGTKIQDLNSQESISIPAGQNVLHVQVKQ